MKFEKRTDILHALRELEQRKILLTQLNESLTKKIDPLILILEGDKSHSERENAQIRILVSELRKELNAKRKEIIHLAEMLSHEFRTPLVPIKAYTDMLLADKFGELKVEQKERLYLVKSSVDRMQDMLDDLILTKQFELEPPSLNMEVVNITELIDRTVSNLQEKAKRKGINITYQAPQKLLCYCDNQRILFVLTRVIENLITIISKPQSKITINEIPDDKYANVEIRGNGIGTSKQVFTSLFTRFFPAIRSSTQEKKGLGLSMYLYKQIIDLHGGKMEFKSIGGEEMEVDIMIPKR